MISEVLQWARRHLQRSPEIDSEIHAPKSDPEVQAPKVEPEVQAPKVDPEVYVGRGHQRLGDGVVVLAAQDLSTAINLAPAHGIALALAAIAAVRAEDGALQEKVIQRYRSASQQQLYDLGEVGKWYSRLPEFGTELNPEMEKNRIAFNTFVERLAPVLEDDKQRLFWLGEGLHTAQLASICSDVLARYRGKYPGHQDAEAMFINATILKCDFASSESFWKEQHARLQRELASGQPISIDPFNLKLSDIDFALFSRVCRQRSLDFMPTDASSVTRKTTTFRSGDRIKLGLVLPYSWFASVNTTLYGLLPEFDRSRFEIIGYAANTAPNPDDFEIQFRKQFDRFVGLDGLDPKASADRIAADGIDVAFEFSGHNRTTCLPIMAYRPAPVQAHLIGWATIIEAPYIDYLITDPHYHPKHLRDLTTETYALMPEGSWAYLPVEFSGREQDRPPNAGPFRFCSFNHLGKIDSESFAAWLDILRGTDDSVLVLSHWNLGDAVRNMRAAAEHAGVDPARIEFLPVAGHVEHLQRLKTMDLALDTLRLGGGVTTMDAFWVGLPVVAACPHENYRYACRGAFGSLSMSEELAVDVPGYVRRAIELRNNPSSLAAFRDKIVARRHGALMFDPPRYAAELQRLVEAIWARHLRGEKPATFTLSAA